jgi:NADPH-dependent 2,4-dienoyl-CoA reductase/sulfur reductase-like enzyme
VLPSPYPFGVPPKQKKICIVGAGSIGGLLAAKFALAGEDVTVIDQGAHLAAIKKNSLTLEWHDGKVHTAKTKAVDKPADTGKRQYDNQRPQGLYPSGILTNKIDPNRIIGCVAYPAAAVGARQTEQRHKHGRCE